MSTPDEYNGPEDSLYHLLAEAARRRPDHIAIDFMGEQMTYGRLAEASSRLAGSLMARGIGPGCRVGFHFHKCFEALVALFGLIRTGATYVPFDLLAPTGRIQKICRQCGIRGILAGALPEGLTDIDWAVVSEPSDAALPDGEVIPLAEAIQDGPAAQGPTPPPEDGIANIIYTSGSTGKPKGVMITTRSLMHFSKWGVETFGLTSADRMGNHAPYSFDLSTFDVFAAVRAGATMCPFPDAARGHPYRTARFIAGERLTIWYCVPWSLVLMVLRGSLHSHDLSRLRHVLFAGEVMPPEHLRSLMDTVPNAAYWNLYGPTETNVCTCHRVLPEDLEDPEGIPIGRPIAETRVWIVDEKNHPVPAGTPGELLVAGPTVFPGYFGDKRASGKRLVDSPEEGMKACRTGDHVVDHGNGVLRFLGRNDRLVKSRGYRIELAEIEAVVTEHPEVVEAAVVPVRHFMRGTSFTCYVSLQDGVELAGKDLGVYCRQHLPNYMVPNHWELLERLPRTPHGKIDLEGLAKQAK
ncbi:MAG: amino acid adenylation domain-containing protein [Phycisphaerae bacterium]|nr:amino acid adenylation domain-containing protein [Phycisphaerae bacterium]